MFRFPERQTLMQTHGIAERARYLKLAAFTLSEGLRSGTFRSAFRGQGLEFDGVREYERGDDIRSIDWNVTARNAKPFVKLYHEERELTVFLVIDTSLSLDVGAQSATVRDRVLETAALLSFAAGHASCPLGAVLFDGELSRVFKPRSGQDQIMSILGALEHHISIVRGSALSAALAGTGRLLRSRALVCVISDFRIDGYEDALGLIARKHDVLAVRINTPLDAALPAAGFLSFLDPESGERLACPTSSVAFQKAWEQENRESVSRWEHVCLRRGVHPFRMETTEDPAAALQRFFIRDRGGAS